MAESFNSGRKTHALNDDTIKQALKAGLEHLKASDALIDETLEKCAAELNKKSKGRSFPNTILSGISIRYCATVLAACLIVFALLLNSPAIWGKGASAQRNSAMLKSQSLDAAGNGANPETDAGTSANKSVRGSASLGIAPSAAPAPSAEASASAAATPAPDAANQAQSAATETPDVVALAPSAVAPYDTADSDKIGLAGFTFGKPSNILYSLSDFDVSQARVSSPVKVAFDAITEAYNKSNGTRYAYDETQALTVSTVPKDGVGADMLRNASSWHDLLGADSYWVLPLKDDKGTIATLLPVFESGAANGLESGAYDISFEFSGETWISSACLGIPADNGSVLMMFDKNALEKKIRDTFNADRVTELAIADINNGRDFMAFITANDKEYAIPLFTDSAINTLVNGQAYGIREAFDKLAQYLDPQK